MRQLPYLSHVFTPLPGAAPGMAHSTAAAMVTVSGSALMDTVENSTASERHGDSRRAGTRPATARGGARSNGAGSAERFRASGAERDPAPGASRLDSTPRTTDPTGSTGPADRPVPPNEEYGLARTQ
ncbi:hypothetical protein JOC24_002861 [Streptomyces sp. HB132]|nr:hypothetical protein [Streptomyces sp. HB132]